MYILLLVLLAVAVQGDLPDRSQQLVVHEIPASPEPEACGNATHPALGALEKQEDDHSTYPGNFIPPDVPHWGEADIVATEDEAGRTCSAFQACDECLGMRNHLVNVGCGWCPQTKTCMVGTVDGPSGSPSIVNCTNWDFGFCSGEPCSAYKNCFQCVQDPFCGWCGETAECLEGTDAGPLFSFCAHWEAHRGNRPEQCSSVRDAFPTQLTSYNPPKPAVMMEYPAAA